MWPLLFIASLLPVWRIAGQDKPFNAWQYISQELQHPKKHIPVEEAIERAREAGYLEGSGRAGIAG